MGNLDKNIFLKILLSVCALMQVLVMMPHHHHDGSQAPCINPLHCIDEAADTSSEEHLCEVVSTPDHGCCGTSEDRRGHRHDSPDGDCSMAVIDVFHPDREKYEEIVCPFELFPEDVFFAVSTMARIECPVNSLIYEAAGVDGFSPPGRIHTEYIISAIPPRAPSFTV